MPRVISFQPMRVLIDGHDSEGRLILADDQLAAVFVRLDGQTHNPEHKGLRHLEAGFGKCNVRDTPLFKTPDEAGAWVKNPHEQGRVIPIRRFMESDSVPKGSVRTVRSRSPAGRASLANREYAPAVPSARLE